VYLFDSEMNREFEANSEKLGQKIGQGALLFGSGQHTGADENYRRAAPKSHVVKARRTAGVRKWGTGRAAQFFNNIKVRKIWGP